MSPLAKTIILITIGLLIIGVIVVIVVQMQSGDGGDNGIAKPKLDTGSYGGDTTTKVDEPEPEVVVVDEPEPEVVVVDEPEPEVVVVDEPGVGVLPIEFVPYNALKYGDIVHIQNQYQPKSYLETCSGSWGCGGVYRVHTHASPKRAGTLVGSWKLIGGDVGSLVKYGDTVHIQNQYSLKPYLDVCGKSRIKICNGTYRVHTHASPKRDGPSGSWKIVGGDIGNPVVYDVGVHIQNQYSPKPYLETCAATWGCGGTFSVQTHTSPKRAGTLVGTWKFIKA